LKILHEDAEKKKKYYDVPITEEESWRFSHKQIVEALKCASAPFNRQMVRKKKKFFSKVCLFFS